MEEDPCVFWNFLMEAYENRKATHPPRDRNRFPPLAWDGWAAIASDMQIEVDNPAFRARQAVKISLNANENYFNGKFVDWGDVEEALQEICVGAVSIDDLPFTQQLEEDAVANAPFIAMEEKNKRGKRLDPSYWVAFPDQGQDSGEWFTRGGLKKAFPNTFKTMLENWKKVKAVAQERDTSEEEEAAKVDGAAGAGDVMQAAGGAAGGAGDGPAEGPQASVIQGDVIQTNQYRPSQETQRTYRQPSPSLSALLMEATGGSPRSALPEAEGLALESPIPAYDTFYGAQQPVHIPYGAVLGGGAGPRSHFDPVAMQLRPLPLVANGVTPGFGPNFHFLPPGIAPGQLPSAVPTPQMQQYAQTWQLPVPVPQQRQPAPRQWDTSGPTFSALLGYGNPHAEAQKYYSGPSQPLFAENYQPRQPMQQPPAAIARPPPQKRPLPHSPVPAPRERRIEKQRKCGDLGDLPALHRGYGVIDSLRYVDEYEYLFGMDSFQGQKGKEENKRKRDVVDVDGRQTRSVADVDPSVHSEEEYNNSRQPDDGAYGSERPSHESPNAIRQRVGGALVEQHAVAGERVMINLVSDGSDSDTIDTTKDEDHVEPQKKSKSASPSPQPVVRLTRHQEKLRRQQAEEEERKAREQEEQQRQENKKEQKKRRSQRTAAKAAQPPSGSHVPRFASQKPQSSMKPVAEETDEELEFDAEDLDPEQWEWNEFRSASDVPARDALLKKLVRYMEPDMWASANFTGAKNCLKKGVQVWVAWDDGFKAVIPSRFLQKGDKIHCMRSLIDFYESKTKKKGSEKPGGGDSKKDKERDSPAAEEAEVEEAAAGKGKRSRSIPLRWQIKRTDV